MTGRYVYRGRVPLGQAARVADPGVDENEPTRAETVERWLYDEPAREHPDGPRAALDMEPGTPVDVADQEDDLVVVAWADRFGNPRRTSLCLAQFESDFEQAG